ncbi:MAG: protein-L-isoaspartate O-methyltransferase [bacterium]
MYRAPKSNDELIDIVERRRNYLGIPRFDPLVIEVMRKLDRAEFAPRGAKNVYEDEPLVIGWNQTCSQPSMVAAMATLLELKPGLKVLEIGAGSGYSAAVTAALIAPDGELISIEYIPELSGFAGKNLEKFSRRSKITLITGDGSTGKPDLAPFDRIYLTAGVGRKFKPDNLIAQLADGGRLLYPEAFGSLFLYEKTTGEPKKREFSGVGFVYLQGADSGFD